MYIDQQFHKALMKINYLPDATKWCDQKAKEYPNVYKGVLVANHLFRAVAIWAFLKYNRSSMKVKLAMCFTGSMVYRLTVESNCAYKFALPAFFGGAALLTAGHTTAKILNGSAFRTFKSIGNATLNMVPITGYLAYIVLTTSYDVDHPKKTCSK